MKPLTTAQAALMRKTRGTPRPPTAREPAADLKPLSPAERLQEHLEARRLQTGWRERGTPPKGLRWRLATGPLIAAISQWFLRGADLTIPQFVSKKVSLAEFFPGKGRTAK